MDNSWKNGNTLSAVFMAHIVPLRATTTGSDLQKMRQEIIKAFYTVQFTFECLVIEGRLRTDVAKSEKMARIVYMLPDRETLKRLH